MRKKRSNSKSFYIVTAIVLLAVGAITRFTVGETTTPKKEETSSISSKPDTSSKIEQEEIDIKIEEDDEEIVEIEDIEEPSEENEDKETKEAGTENFVTYSMPIEGEISKGFDLEKLQYSKTYGDMRVHFGIDILADESTPIKSAGAGKVVSIEDNALWGTVITIDHGNGVKSIYCGVEDVKVKIDDTVRQGKIIGLVGKIPSESKDKPHLHFEMKNNDGYLSPLKAMGLE